MVLIPLDLSQAERTIQLIKDLNPMVRDGIIRRLERYKDMFAFNPIEMPGVALKVMKHRLSENSSHKLVV